jgi:hypothetical protein
MAVAVAGLALACACGGRDGSSPGPQGSEQPNTDGAPPPTTVADASVQPRDTDGGVDATQVVGVE